MKDLLYPEPIPGPCVCTETKVGFGSVLLAEETCPQHGCDPHDAPSRIHVHKRDGTKVVHSHDFRGDHSHETAGGAIFKSKTKDFTPKLETPDPDEPVTPMP